MQITMALGLNDAARHIVSKGDTLGFDVSGLLSCKTGDQPRRGSSRRSASGRFEHRRKAGVGDAERLPVLAVARQCVVERGDVQVGPSVQREAIAYLRAEHGLSERRACHIVGADLSVVRHRSRRAPGTVFRGRSRELANERRRFRYRRLFVLLRREGKPSRINRIYRHCREEGLMVRKRKARRKTVGTRAPILVEARANARWSLDFVHDQFANGQRLRGLNVVDDVTRECLAAIPNNSISGRRVARELTAPLGHQLDRLDLELAAELPSRHIHSPVPWSRSYLGVHGTGSSSR